MFGTKWSMADPRLTCLYNHQMKLAGKVKFWRGHLHLKDCGNCHRQIGRQASRWRCSEGCKYNICEDCYKQHWLNVIRLAEGTSEPSRRRQLLSFIPRDLCTLPDYVRVSQMQTPVKGFLQSHVNDSAFSTSLSHEFSFGKEPGVESDLEEQVNGSHAIAKQCIEAVVCFSLWTASTIVTGFIFHLLRDAFPYVCVSMGFSFLGVYILLILVTVVFRRRIAGGHIVTWKVSGKLGIAACVEFGLSVWILRDVSVLDRCLLRGALFPCLLFGANVLMKREFAQPRVIVALCLVTISGIFGLSWPFTPWRDVTEMFPFALVMVLVSVWRMLETQSALFPTNEDLLEPSPLLLAVRMAPSVMLTAFGTETSLELVSTSGLSALVEVENPGQVFYLFLAAAAGFAILLLSQLRLLQLTSATMLGFLTPLQGLFLALTTNIKLMVDGEDLVIMVVLNVIGVFVFIVGFVLYIRTRWDQFRSRTHDEESTSTPVKFTTSNNPTFSSSPSADNTLLFKRPGADLSAPLMSSVGRM